MKDVPIIFSAPMVLALLREAKAPGTGKSMTRRLAWRDVMIDAENLSSPMPRAAVLRKAAGPAVVPTPWQKVKPGDRLWVREGWKPHSLYEAMRPRDMPRSKVFYLADETYSPSGSRGRPSIHMPRWASRLTLVVTKTKTEWLQSISEADAIAEGVEHDEKYPTLYKLYHPLPGNAPGLMVSGFARVSFRSLWMSLHGPDVWDANPAVVALTFTVHAQNIDAMKEAA